MNRNRPAVAFMSTLAVVILAYSCGESPDPGPGRVLSQRIVGEWVSDPFQSQFGMSTEAFCFTSDNRVVGWHEVEGIPGRVGRGPVDVVLADHWFLSHDAGELVWRSNRVHGSEQQVPELQIHPKRLLKCGVLPTVHQGPCLSGPTSRSSCRFVPQLIADVSRTSVSSPFAEPIRERGCAPSLGGWRSVLAEHQKPVLRWLLLHIRVALESVRLERRRSSDVLLLASNDR